MLTVRYISFFGVNLVNHQLFRLFILSNLVAAVCLTLNGGLSIARNTLSAARNTLRGVPLKMKQLVVVLEYIFREKWEGKLECHSKETLESHSNEVWKIYFLENQRKRLGKRLTTSGQCYTRVETSQLILKGNPLTGFYMSVTLLIKKTNSFLSLSIIRTIIHTFVLNKHKRNRNELK